MKITAILCTYNRWKMLATALDSIAKQTLPESVEWEVLVVDNNSRDQTREVVEDFSRRHPRHFRYLFEPQQGKSYALNAGIREAKGEVLAFMDDDVTVDPRWLDNLTAPLRNGEWAGSGGRTISTQSFTPPDWLALEGPYCMMGVIYAHFDLGDEPCELDIPPYGTNMAFRRVMFEKYGGFRADLGPRPGSEIRGEDTELGRRLMAAGEHLRYEPSAVVYHSIPEGRVTKDFFLTWWLDFGRATVREWGRGQSVLGIPRPYLNILKLGTIELAQKLGRWIFTLNPKRRFYHKCRVWVTAGQIKEYFRLARITQTKGAQSISI
jgi:glycosyltransferase involved in cell wall biosynthesis